MALSAPRQASHTHTKRKTGRSSQESQLAWNSSYSQSIQQRWKQETSGTLEDWSGIDILPMFCAGLTLPISNDLWQDVMDFSYQMVKAQTHNKETSEEVAQMTDSRFQCFTVLRTCFFDC